MASPRTRLARPGEDEALLKKAKTFLEVAKSIHSRESVEEPYVESACAVLCILGGIAASDSACANALGRVFRGQDHREACGLLAEVTVRGTSGHKAATALAELLAVKDEAQYGVLYLSGVRMKTVFRRVSLLIDFAETVRS